MRNTWELERNDPGRIRFSTTLFHLGAENKLAKKQQPEFFYLYQFQQVFGLRRLLRSMITVEIERPNLTYGNPIVPFIKKEKQKIESSY